jgi:hypothetical protein
MRLASGEITKEQYSELIAVIYDNSPSTGSDLRRVPAFYPIAEERLPPDQEQETSGAMSWGRAIALLAVGLYAAVGYNWYFHDDLNLTLLTVALVITYGLKVFTEPRK